jgi:error-prone DNA polymerase
LTGPGQYCELHAHSCYSLLDGVPFPESLVERAAEVDMPAIALTDHDALYGAVPFFARARELGVKPLLGVELTVAGGGMLGGHLTLLAENQAGYRHLCQLVTLARAGRPKGEAALPEELLPELAGGLICLTGCRLGPVARPLAEQHPSQARAALERLVEIFGRTSVYVEVQRCLGRDDKRLTHALSALAASSEFGLKCVATSNVHYLSREDGDLQDALVSIRVRAPLPQAGRYLRPNHEYFLRSAAAMLALHADMPEAVHNTIEVGERCTVALPAGLQVLPVFPTPPGLTAQAYMRQLCQEQLPRYYSRLRAPEAQALLEKELGMIEHLGLANYFLVVWDIVNFCQRRGILCHGRGSAANSLVARLLGISAVDPIAQGLVVERFLSVEHGGTPDIDLDIDAARREIVIQYVYDRWGRDHAAMACTYITYRSASSIRDAGYALGYKPEVIEELGSALEAQRRQKVPDADGRLEPPDVPLAEVASEAAALSGRKGPLNAATTQRLVDLAARLQKRPRHLGLHSGGMVITGDPIANLVPVEPATMEDRTVVQFDKEYLEELGIVKIDLLGLRMLAAIADAVELVRIGRGEFVDFRHLDFRDRAVFDLICSAHTIGIFQVESGAQVSVIPHLQPRCFQDLVVEISLIRPGPLQGNMVRPYLRRRQGLEPVTYLHPDLKPALAETLGVIVFQEQVIKLARDFAGLAPGRGEVLRRALGKKHALEALAGFKDEFAAGARGRGVPEAVIEQVWQMIANFAGYSFSKAHAAAFAVIVYWSAWLRVHYPVEYFCGLLRNAPLGTYPANVLESEARRVGVGFLPFDINRSLAKATVEASGRCSRAASSVSRDPGRRYLALSGIPVSSRGPLEGRDPGQSPASTFQIRYGLDYVKGIGEERAEAIVQVRGEQPFESVADFIARTDIPQAGSFGRRTVEALVLSGAFDAFGERRQLLWDLAEAYDIARRPAPQLALQVPDEQASLAPMPADLRLMRTFAVTGVTAGPHLTEVRRDAFARAGCTPYRKLQAAGLRNGARVKVGGLVADGLRRPPTAKGTSFIRLEDADGLVDVIVPLAVYAQCREALRAAFVVVEGTLQRNGTVISVVARSVKALPS